MRSGNPVVGFGIALFFLIAGGVLSTAGELFGEGEATSTFEAIGAIWAVVGAGLLVLFYVIKQRSG